MFNIEIKEDGLSKIIGKISDVNAGKLPNTERAIKTAGEFVRDEWRRAVRDAVEVEYDGQTFTVHRRTGNYERQIVAIYPYMTKLATLVEANASYADAIENGVAPYDMKPGLLKGRQFVRIPFRHGTGEEGKTSPTGLKNMPQSIHEMMQQSKRLGKVALGQRSKIVKDINGEIHRHTWSTGPYSGMIRSGESRHHQYTTFRTVSVNSPADSWWHPGTPPRPLSKAIGKAVLPFLQEMTEEALKQDLGLGE